MSSTVKYYISGHAGADSSMHAPSKGIPEVMALSAAAMASASTRHWEWEINAGQMEHRLAEKWHSF